MTDRELMQQALDALDSDNPDIQLRAAIALRNRLAQPEQEPVAWICEGSAGLTHEDIVELIKKASKDT